MDSDGLGAGVSRMDDFSFNHHIRTIHSTRLDCSNDVTKLLDRIDENDRTSISSIVVAMRLLLFDKYIFSNTADRMVEGLEVLLRQLSQQLPRLTFALPISSVAAADHLRAQSFVNEKKLDPPLQNYSASYDRCKRQSEDMITELCRTRQLSCSHLRLSAFFSDDYGCIQCSALGLKARVGCYLPLAIDCNSSLNASKAIFVLLEKARQQKQQPSVYYYTRPLTLPKPVPYGYYLTEYRKAYNIQQFSLWIPVWTVTSLLSLVHVLARLNQHYFGSRIPYLDAADYLLQVAAREHSFDNGAFRQLIQDEIQQGSFQEECILDCFARRKEYL